MTQQQQYDLIKESLESRCIISEEAQEYLVRQHSKQSYMILLYNYLQLSPANYLTACEYIMKTGCETIRTDKLCRLVLKLIKEGNVKNAFDVFEYQLYKFKYTKYYSEFVNIIIENSSDIKYGYMTCCKLLEDDSVKLTSKNREKIQKFILSQKTRKLKFTQIQKFIKEGYIILNNRSVYELIRRDSTIELLKYLINECKYELTIDHIIAACKYGSRNTIDYLYNEYIKDETVKYSIAIEHIGNEVEQ